MSNSTPSFEAEGYSGALNEPQCQMALRLWNKDCLPLLPFIRQYGLSYEKIDIQFSYRHWEIAEFLTGGFLESDLLLYIPEYGVWPFSNAYPTFHYIRQANGEGRAVKECPGQVLESRSAFATSLVHIAIISEWDVCIASPLPHCMWYFSHEGWLRFLSDDPVTDALVRDYLGVPRSERANPSEGL